MARCISYGFDGCSRLTCLAFSCQSSIDYVWPEIATCKGDVCVLYTSKLQKLNEIASSQVLNMLVWPSSIRIPLRCLYSKRLIGHSNFLVCVTIPGFLVQWDVRCRTMLFGGCARFSLLYEQSDVTWLELVTEGWHQADIIILDSWVHEEGSSAFPKSPKATSIIWTTFGRTNTKWWTIYLEAFQLPLIIPIVVYQSPTDLKRYNFAERREGMTGQG